MNFIDDSIIPAYGVITPACVDTVDSLKRVCLIVIHNNKLYELVPIDPTTQQIISTKLIKGEQ